MNEYEPIPDIEAAVEQLLTLQALLTTSADDIFKLTDACVNAFTKDAVHANNAMVRKYLRLIERIDDYKTNVQSYKHILMTDIAFQDAKPNSLEAQVLEKYTHGLIIRVLLDEHRLQRPAMLVDKALAETNPPNPLLQRWSKELSQFRTFECV